MVRIGAILALVGCCVAATFAQGLDGTRVSIAVDFSKSFAPFDSQDERTLVMLADSIATLGEKSWKPPVIVHWSRIGSSSVSLEPPCPPIEFGWDGLIRPPSAITPQGFRIGLEECAKGLVVSSKRPGALEPFTDITGAIRVATERTTSKGASKVLVVYSDFVEDHPPNFEPVDLKMHGEHCVLLYRPEAGDRLNPKRLYTRLEQWKQKLLTAGASRVEIGRIGLTELELMQLLSPAEGR